MKNCLDSSNLSAGEAYSFPLYVPCLFSPLALTFATLQDMPVIEVRCLHQNSYESLVLINCFSLADGWSVCLRSLDRCHLAGSTRLINSPNVPLGTAPINSFDLDIKIDILNNKVYLLLRSYNAAYTE